MEARLRSERRTLEATRLLEPIATVENDGVVNPSANRILKHLCPRHRPAQNHQRNSTQIPDITPRALHAYSTASSPPTPQPSTQRFVFRHELNGPHQRISPNKAPPRTKSRTRQRRPKLWEVHRQLHLPCRAQSPKCRSSHSSSRLQKHSPRWKHPQHNPSSKQKHPHRSKAQERSLSSEAVLQVVRIKAPRSCSKLQKQAYEPGRQGSALGCPGALSRTRVSLGSCSKLQQQAHAPS